MGACDSAACNADIPDRSTVPAFLNSDLERVRKDGAWLRGLTVAPDDEDLQVGGIQTGGPAISAGGKEKEDSHGNQCQEEGTTGLAAGRFAH